MESSVNFMIKSGEENDASLLITEHIIELWTDNIDRHTSLETLIILMD